MWRIIPPSFSVLGHALKCCSERDDEMTVVGRLGWRTDTWTGQTPLCAPSWHLPPAITTLLPRRSLRNKRWTCYPFPKNPRPPYRKQFQGLWMTICHLEKAHVQIHCLASLQLAYLQPISHSFHWFIDLKVVSLGNSLAAQWLWLRALTARGLSPIPGWGTKIPQASRQDQKSSIFVLFKLLFNSYVSLQPTLSSSQVGSWKVPKAYDSCSWQELHRTLYYAEHVHMFLFELCLVNMLHFLKSILEAGPDGDPKCATSKGIGSAKQAVPGASGHVTHFANGALWLLREGLCSYDILPCNLQELLSSFLKPIDRKKEKPPMVPRHLQDTVVSTLHLPFSPTSVHHFVLKAITSSVKFSCTQSRVPHCANTLSCPNYMGPGPVSCLGNQVLSHSRCTMNRPLREATLQGRACKQTVLPTPLPWACASPLGSWWPAPWAPSPLPRWRDAWFSPPAAAGSQRQQDSNTNNQERMWERQEKGPMPRNLLQVGLYQENTPEGVAP